MTFGFDEYGILIDSSGDQVEGCYIGTDASGTAAVPNSGQGIYVDSSSSNATIGGTASGDANVISGNGNYGVFIDATDCLVAGNKIGTDAGGTAAVPNSNAGISVFATGATIGGTASGDANVISGNVSDGINIGAPDCLVERNEIGTDAGGTAAVPNGYGIFVLGSNATIGGTASGDANVISGSGSYGVLIDATDCLVAGNKIGTDAGGTAAVPNGYGIFVLGSNATIGGTAPGDANVISGNGSYGVFIEATDCLVEGNQIGTNATGTAAVPNSGDGILVFATGATIGGTASGDANVISGNKLSGINILATDCLVEGNEIGTDAGGTAAVPNSNSGILVSAFGATIGGTSAGDANVISGNGYIGVFIDNPCLVEGNLIGTDRTGANPVPNQGIGVYLEAGTAVATTIGAAGAGNIIAFNGGPGVATYLGSSGGTIRFNAIFSNGGPGIDRNDDEITPNSPNGANNTPILASASGGIVTGELNAAPNSTYVVDIYANLPSDASAERPQGRDYLTSTTVTTNLAGDAVFDVPYTPFPGEPILTATATDAAGTTSEFSPPLGYVLTATGVTFAAMTHVPFQGTVAAFSSSDPTATAADFTATINFGDGSPSASGTIVAAPAGFLVVSAHSFSTANPIEPVTVTITDTRGFGQATANSVATITSPGGLLTPFGQSASFVAGTLSSAVVASFIDSSLLSAIPGEFTARINWGDGNASSAGTIAISGAGFTVTGSHTYNVDPISSPIVESVTVSITDTLTGDTVTATTTATVAPVPITIQTRNFDVTGRKPFSGTVATFTDGDDRTNPAFYTATINWGDNTPPTTGTVTGTNPFTVTASHTFAPFPNTRLVTITITDNNGRTATGVDRVVDPPVVSAALSQRSRRPDRRRPPSRPRRPLHWRLPRTRRRSRRTSHSRGSWRRLATAAHRSRRARTRRRSIGAGLPVEVGDDHGEQRPVRGVGPARFPAVHGREDGDDHGERRRGPGGQRANDRIRGRTSAQGDQGDEPSEQRLEATSLRKEASIGSRSVRRRSPDSTVRRPGGLPAASESRPSVGRGKVGRPRHNRNAKSLSASSFVLDPSGTRIGGHGIGGHCTQFWDRGRTTVSDPFLDL